MVSMMGISSPASKSPIASIVYRQEFLKDTGLTPRMQSLFQVALVAPENVLFFHSPIQLYGFAPIFPDICYHLTHYRPAAADIPVASDNPAHYADAIRYNARTPLQGSLLPLTRLVWA